MRIFDSQGREIETLGLVDEYNRPIQTLDYGSRMAEAQHALMSLGQDEEDRVLPEKFRGYNKVPAQYPVNIELSSDVSNRLAQNAGSAPLRPEPFLCKGITWGCTADAPNVEGEPAWDGEEMTPSGSTMGRVTEMQWADEFAQFMGDRWALIVAVLGDSNGFYPLPKWVLFQGKQSLKIRLRLIRWPYSGIYEGQTWPMIRYDFVFHGVGLLPPGVEISGSGRPG